MLRVFGYLKQRPDGRLLCDPSHTDHASYPSPPDHNWHEFYPDAEEELPSNAPDPKGRGATITCYVDADHAHDQVTRRSVTGILLFVNGMPIKWMSLLMQIDMPGSFSTTAPPRLKICRRQYGILAMGNRPKNGRGLAAIADLERHGSVALQAALAT